MSMDKALEILKAMRKKGQLNKKYLNEFIKIFPDLYKKVNSKTIDEILGEINKSEG